MLLLRALWALLALWPPFWSLKKAELPSPSRSSNYRLFSPWDWDNERESFWRSHRRVVSGVFRMLNVKPSTRMVVSLAYRSHHTECSPYARTEAPNTNIHSQSIHMTTTFAERIRNAATDFPGEHSTAWVQYFVKDGTVYVTMQAPEIMKQFRGSVKFGVDPKGILFYKNKGDLDSTGQIRIRNQRYAVKGPWVIAESEFGSIDDPFKAFARFVALVNTDTYPIPNFSNALGEGRLSPFDAVTCHALAYRRTDQTTMNLDLDAIHKQAYFTSQVNTQFTQNGILFFLKLGKLQTRPPPRPTDYCVANYNRDRIVFHIEGVESEEVALFLPNKPMTEIGPMPTPGPPRVTWRDVPFSLTLRATDVEDDGGVVEASA